MPGLSSLETGKRALMAQRLGLDVTSNNIANVNTPGYSRRSALLSETYPNTLGGKFIGSGVMAERLRTYREDFFDREIRMSYSRQFGFEADAKIFNRIETMLGEPSGINIGETADNFFNFFNELAASPADTGLRENVLSKAKTLVEQFHTLARNISDTRQEVHNMARLNVENANSLISDIAKLNKSITSTTKFKQESQTLIDQRELKLEELSKILDINVTTNADGALNVFSGGINLVTAGIANKLKLNEKINAATGERTLQLQSIDHKGNVLNNIKPNGGELESQLRHFNITLDDKDTSGGFSVMKQIDAFANAIVQNVNSITVDGYGLDDDTAPPPGRSFFAPETGTATAATIEISTDVLNDARAIPLSDSPDEQGNNVIAMRLAGLASDSGFLNGETPASYYATFAGNFGMISKEASNGKEASGLISSQLESQRESIIGVNTDEEAVNLVKYQKAFEAASRVINTTSQLLTTVINLGR